MTAMPAAPTPVVTMRRRPSRSLADDVERVQERREDDDRRPVLVVVEDRDVELARAGARSISKQRGRGDVLEVDPAEPRRDRLARPRRSRRDPSSRGRSATRRRRANSLKSAALPSITGSAASGPMSPEPEHRRPVGDDRDRVLLDREVPGRARGRRRSRPQIAGDARRVGHREVVARLERRSSERSRSFRRGGGGRCGRRRARPRRRRARGRRRRSARGGPRRSPRHGDVADLLAGLDADDVDRVEQATGVADRLGEPRERAGAVRQAAPAAWR